MAYYLHTRTIKTYLLYVCVCFVFFYSCSQSESSNSISNQDIDKASKNELVSYFNAFKKTSVDTVSLKKMLRIIDQKEVQNDTSLFLEYNTYVQQIAVRPTFKNFLAETYWNSATYFLGFNDYINAFKNYKKAYELYSSINEEYYAAKMLYNMAFIQGRVKDNYGAENNLFLAISIYKKLNKSTSLYKSYNLLGNIYTDINDFENAIVYHQKGIALLPSIKKENDYFEASSNDIGLVYQKQEKYQDALRFFRQALQDGIATKDIRLYATIQDNIANAKLLLLDTTGVYRQLSESFTIRDSINDSAGRIVSKLHLASYYALKQDTIKAIILAKEANIASKEINNNRDILSSYELLSQVDQENSKQYFARYIAINDSIQIQDDAIKNKFARLRFETDDYISQNETLVAQRTKIVIISLLVIGFLTLLYFLINQRQKNKLLLAEQENEATNKEVSRLIYEQQMTLENGRLQERNRIAEELHDGVLGKLFGTRMKIGFLKVAEKDTSELKENIVSLLDLEKDIRKISHNLKSNISASKQDFGLIVESLLKEQSTLSGYAYHFHATNDVDWNKISEEQKIELFRIVQEALQNINKHAHAKNVYIEFDKISDHVEMIIKDDGVGFETTIKRNGIGLENIKNRAARLQATFTLNSMPKEGTILKIVFLHTANT